MQTYLPRVIIALVLLVGGYFGYQAYQRSQQYESTDNAQIEGNWAPLLARVAGYVQAVNVDDHATIKRGQPLVTIDSQEYDVALTQVEADYRQTVADLATARADLKTARATTHNVTQNARVAQSTAQVQASRRDKARQDLQRDQNLYKEQSLTRKQLEDTQNGAEVQGRQYETNVEQIALARTSQGVAQAGIVRAEANIQKVQAVLKVKQATIDNAKLRQGYARLTAPIAGKIGRKNVIVGQCVQPGQNLFTIVADSTFRVVANFKETQSEKMKLGQEVNVSLDAYPDLNIRGRLASVSDATGARFALLPADNASGNFVKVTQRVPVKIEILNPDRYKDQLRGYVAFATFCFTMSTYNADASNSDFIWALIIRGIGLALVNVPLINQSVSTLEPRQLPTGIAIVNMMRQLGGAFGVANTYVTQRMALHRYDLVSNLQPKNPALAERLNAITQGLIARGINSFDAVQGAYKNLDLIVSRQALMISYLDTFRLAGLFFVFSFPLLFLLKSKKMDAVAAKAVAAH